MTTITTLNESDNGAVSRGVINTNFDNLNTGKVEVVAGKGLSTEDYTTAEKTKLAGIGPGADMASLLYDPNGLEKDLYKTSNTIYVDSNKGSDVVGEGNGSVNAPYASISFAHDQITDNAIDNKYMIEVAAGTYLPFTTKSYVFVRGLGAIVESPTNTGPLITFTGDQSIILQLTFNLNPTVAGQTIVACDFAGFHEMNFCAFNLTTTADVPANIAKITAGSIAATASFTLYNQTGTSALVSEHNILDISGTGSMRPLRSDFEIYIADESNNVNLIKDSGSGVFLSSQLSILGFATNPAYTGEFNIANITGAADFKVSGYSTISIQGAGSGTGQVLKLDSSGAGNVVDVTFNRIEITGFATNRGGNIATGDTVNAYFNEIAVDELSIGGGQINIASADTDGNFIVSTNIVDLNTFIGNSTNQSLQDLFNIGFNAGWVSGGEQSEPGIPDGTLTVAAGSGNIRISNDEQASLKMFDWAEATGLTFTTGVTSYVYVDYNAGTPNIQVTTNLTDIEDNENDKFELYAVFKEDATTIHVADHRHRAKNVGTRVQQFLHEEALIKRTKGLLLGGTGIRYITMTAGRAWIKLNPLDLGPKDTSVADTFDYYYGCATTCTKVPGQTQWNNLQYDLNGVLTTYINGRYGFIDQYLDADNNLIGVYCTDQYNSQAVAENAANPISPARVNDNGLYIGRLVFLEGTDAPVSVLSPFTGQDLQATPITDHGSLTGLTDDDHLQYTLNAGRSGGQTIYGSTDAGENITIESTSNVTKGVINLNGDTQVTGTIEATNLSGTNTGDQDLTAYFNKTTDDLDDINAGVTNKHFTATDETKLDGIEAGAEVNNISDINATDLTDGLDSTLHFHASDRDLANATGVLSITNGGTGQSTKTNAFDNLAPSTTKGDLIVNNGADNVRLGAGTNGQIIIADSVNANGVKYDGTLTVDSTNNRVGVGTTTPNKKIEIADTTPIIRTTDTRTSTTTGDDLGGLEMYTNDGDAPHVAAYVKAIATSTFGRLGQLAFGVSQTINTDATEAMRIIENGNVGIGTISPSGKLHVKEDEFTANPILERTNRTTDVLWSSAKIKATKTTSMADGFGSGITYSIEDDTSGEAILGIIGAERAGADNTGDIVLAPATVGVTAEKMRIKSSGNVGIGTTTPTAKLHVGGTSGVDGIKFPDGTLQTTAATGGGGGASEEFYATQSAGQSITTTATKITFNTETFDTGANFNTTLNRYVAPSTGLYSFSYAIGAFGLTSGDRFYTQVYKNGVSIHTHDGSVSGDGRPTNTQTLILELTAADYIEVYVRNITATRGTTRSGVADTYFCGYQLK